MCDNAAERIKDSTDQNGGNGLVQNMGGGVGKPEQAALRLARKSAVKELKINYPA